MTYLFQKMKSVHFVGIGGIGMSGIAELLAAQGFTITGSDLSTSPITKHLQDCGCTIYKGHRPDHVGSVNVVVHSSAVDKMNPELREAARRGIPIISRAEMLAELMRLKQGVAIAGTHGKTTTTSLIGHILTSAGLDPTVVVGGVVRGLGTNARLGQSDLLVAEADEYDRSFLKLMPILSVLTTLEPEHLDTYGDYESLKEAFLHFANSVPFYGKVVVCGDEPNLVELLPDIRRPVVTYGFNPQADLRGESVKIGEISQCRVVTEGEDLGVIQVPLTGQHNLRNALAAIAIARELEVPFDKIRSALIDFEGIKRRFEKRGEVKGALLYDDYAHHPTEVRMTLAAARHTFKRRVVAVFQPHLYSRTQTFYREFAQELLAADMLIVADVYPSREEPIEGVSGKLIADQAVRFAHKNVHYVPEKKKLAKTIHELIGENDLVITLGAGDIHTVSEDLLKLG